MCLALILGILCVVVIVVSCISYQKNKMNKKVLEFQDFCNKKFYIKANTNGLGHKKYARFYDYKVSGSTFFILYQTIQYDSFFRRYEISEQVFIEEFEKFKEKYRPQIPDIDYWDPTAYKIDNYGKIR